MRRIQLVLKLSIHSNVGVGLCSTRWFWYYATPVAGGVEPRPYNVVGVLYHSISLYQKTQVQTIKPPLVFLIAFNK